MKNAWWLLGFFVMGCSASASVRTESGSDENLALSEVPAHVKEAALKAVPGLVLTEAEKEVENGVTVYSLTGTSGGKEHEVEVSSGGEVMEIETDDDGEDEDDEDDEDDGEDEDDD